MDICLLWVLCCQVEVSAMGRSLVQRSPKECSVSQCDRGTSITRRPRPTRAVESLNNFVITWIKILSFPERSGVADCEKSISTTSNFYWESKGKLFPLPAKEAIWREERWTFSHSVPQQ
jgi:hypothetical protein